MGNLYLLFKEESVFLSEVDGEAPSSSTRTIFLISMDADIFAGSVGPTEEWKRAPRVMLYSPLLDR
jgi:hypothetical protein